MRLLFPSMAVLTKDMFNVHETMESLRDDDDPRGKVYVVGKVRALTVRLKEALRYRDARYHIPADGAYVRFLDRIEMKSSEELMKRSYSILPFGEKK